MILTHPGLTKLTFMDYLLTMLRILLRRKLLHDNRRNDPREAWGSREDTQSRPPEALDRCTGATGGVGTARNTRHHSWS